jgi:hypothetical protein
MMLANEALKQAYFPREVQYAFKNLLTHCVLQFAVLIAVCYVLHRHENRDIHR